MSFLSMVYLLMKSQKKNMRNYDAPKFLSLIKIIRKIGDDEDLFCTLIKCLDEKSIKFLCESVKNGIPRKHVRGLNPRTRKNLLHLITPNRSLLKKICRKSKFYSMNKKKLLQKGAGFFIPLLSTLIPLVSSLISK